MAHDEQLEWEARAGRPVAAAAFGAAVLGIAGTVYAQAAIAGTEGAVGAVKKLDEVGAHFIAGAAIEALGIALLAPVLVYLYRAVRYRRPEIPRVALFLAIGGPLLVAGLLIARRVLVVDVAHDVADALPLADTDAEDRFEDVQREGSSAVVGGLYLAGALSLAFALVLVNLNAMRAGLMSRFMGVVGIILGVIYALQFGPPAIIQLFWLGALGLIFLDRWPGGRGPAWESGEAETWPTQADRRAEMEAARAEAEGDGEVEAAEEGARAEEAEEDAEAEPAAAGDAPRPHPRSKKRKRKRRR